MLNAHNVVRKQHGVAPLTLDDKMNNYAQEWADGLAKSNKLQHRSTHTYGENLYMGMKPGGITGVCVCVCVYISNNINNQQARMPSTVGTVKSRSTIGRDRVCRVAVGINQ
jgi:uncharacterized protein YkwD